MNEEIKKEFEKIYHQKIWGEGYDGIIFDYFSGMGSCPDEIIPTELYIKNFCEKFDEKPNIADLGCGDFGVGGKIRKYFNRYDAYDVVPDLIERNKEKYKDLDVNFYFTDICEDFIESSKVALLRHVIQHLDNKSINKLIKNIQDKFDYIIVIQDVYSKEDGIIPPFNNGDLFKVGLSRSLRHSIQLHEPPFVLQYTEFIEEIQFMREEVNPEDDILYYCYRIFQTYKLK